VERSVKVSGKNYEFIKSLSDEADLSIKQVVDRLLSEGLEQSRKVGKAVASNPESLTKVQKDMAKMKGSQEEILDRLDELEGEVSEGDEGDEGDQGGEEPKGRKLKLKVPSVGRKELDGFQYHCLNCGAPLAGEPKEDRRETCRDCGAKLDWEHLETEVEGQGEGSGSNVLLIGFLALLALAFMPSPASTSGRM